MKKELNSYSLSRNWFDFSFENPEKIKPNHTALYFFTIEHCNRLGWKRKFGLPTTMAKDAIGIRSYNTYISTLNDLVEWGFIELIEKSKNQYSSNIVALSNFNKALDKALDKAFIKHDTKQLLKQSESIGSIDKQVNNKPINNISSDLDLAFNDFLEMRKKIKKPVTDRALKMLKKKLVELASDEKTQIKIIEQSIVNCWQNFFELKDDNFNKKSEGVKNDNSIDWTSDNNLV
ncbi:hypothetical protein, partial [Winogradskyella sp.]|uniref:hypothetical protein n=1 Tax=Winogradskyella sp. TaxID=1883156 RepID=UPI0025DC31CE